MKGESKLEPTTAIASKYGSRLTALEMRKKELGLELNEGSNE
jgi:hypothetical protein